MGLNNILDLLEDKKPVECIPVSLEECTYESVEEFMDNNDKLEFIIDESTQLR